VERVVNIYFSQKKSMKYFIWLLFLFSHFLVLYLKMKRERENETINLPFTHLARKEKKKKKKKKKVVMAKNAISIIIICIVSILFCSFVIHKLNQQESYLLQLKSSLGTSLSIFDFSCFYYSLLNVFVLFVFFC